MKFINACWTSNRRGELIRPLSCVSKVVPAASVASITTSRISPKGFSAFAFEFALVLALVLLLAGCSTSPQVVELPDEQAINSDVNILDVNVAERQRLLALPNRYKQGAVPVSTQITASVNAALALKVNGDIAGATARLTAISAANPSLSGVALQLGDLALESDNIEQATRYYQQAIRANSDNYFAHNRLGSLYRRQGQFMQAKMSYQAALASWGGFAEAHLNLGILLDIYLDDKQQALAYYQNYQLLSNAKNRQVKGWIADISRQLRAADNG